MKLVEAQVDRIVGPTHHFGGLGVGNVASQMSEGHVSNPAAAAIQGLNKMREVGSLGVPQFVLPPHHRPDFRLLRSLGFSGTDADVLKRSAGETPRLLSAAMSCSAMWTANAATVSAAVDNANKMLTLSVANLVGSLHRAMESNQTLADLRRCFPRARVIPALPGGAALRDEGAANHMRLGSEENKPGLHLFVYGDGNPSPQIYWPRQTLETCQAIARVHRLPPENTFFLKQHPRAIDAGAFHNDVVATSHQGVLIYHERAYIDADETWRAIASRYQALYGGELRSVMVREVDLSLKQAIDTYVFNSQIISGREPGKTVMICPTQVDDNPAARSMTTKWCDQGIIQQIHFTELRQSMSGGGGPACLRLRVPMTEDELATSSQQLRWREPLDGQLREFVEQHYPTSVSRAEFADLKFVRHAENVTKRLQDLLQS